MLDKILDLYICFFPGELAALHCLGLVGTAGATWTYLGGSPSSHGQIGATPGDNHVFVVRLADPVSAPTCGDGPKYAH